MLSILVSFFLYSLISVYASSLDYSNETHYAVKHGSLVPVTTVDIDPPVPDSSTKGRYELNFKAFVNGSRFNYVDFNIEVVNTTRENCNDGYTFNTSSQHSYERLNLGEEAIPAKYVIVSIKVDKIFSGCYSIQFSVNNEGKFKKVVTEDKHLLWIENDYTYNDLKEPDIICSVVYNKTDVVVTFYLREQMIEYSKEVLFLNDTSEIGALECSEAGSNYRCWGAGAMAGARDGSHYTARLSVDEPWTQPLHGVYASAAHTDCNFVYKAGEDKEPTPVAVSPLRAQAVVAAAACSAVALLVLLAAAVLAYRRYFAQHLDKNDMLYNYWKETLIHRYSGRSTGGCGDMESRLVRRSTPPAACTGAGAGAGEGPDADADEIVLVYARDAPPFMHAMALLRTALADLTGAKVWDIWEAGTACAAAEGPVRWAHSKVAGSARLLLVESPAGTMLYHHNPIVGGPNLPTRVQYRQPHYSDYLLHYLLRAAADDLAHDHYSKYFVANIPSFQASEQFPHVSAHRRYALPGALPLLVSHLTVSGHSSAPLPPSTPPADTSYTPLDTRRTPDLSPRDAKLNAYKDQLVRAVLLLDDFVDKNPDYLFEEVMSIENV